MKGFTRKEKFLNAIASGSGKTPTPLTGEEKAMQNIAKMAKSSLELPGVTEDDNGKVLSVVDGAWDKADAPTPALALLSKKTNQSGSSQQTYFDLPELTTTETEGNYSGAYILVVRNADNPGDILVEMLNVYYKSGAAYTIKQVELGKVASLITEISTSMSKNQSGPGDVVNRLIVTLTLTTAGPGAEIYLYRLF